MKALGILFFLAGACSGGTEIRGWEPKERALDAASREALCRGSHDRCDVGLAFDPPLRIDTLHVDYSTLGGRAYEPALTGQALQFWRDGAWRDLRPNLTVDYSRQGAFAPLQGSGYARWTYRFAPVETARVRVLLLAPANPEPWHRVYAVREIEASLTGGAAPESGTRVLGRMPERPAWLEPGANLAVPEAGAVARAGEVRWRRPLMISRLEFAPAAADRVEWWDGAAWRAVEPTGGSVPGIARFLPVSTTGIRVSGARTVRAYLDPTAGEYAREVEHSRFDLLGARFRRMAGPGLNAMRGLLLPMDFAQAAIGRPGDMEEAHVAWNGTFFMTENTAGAAWNTGAAKREPSPERHDRWFALDPAPDWAHSESRYLDGWLPATVTTYRRGGIEYRETLYVTAPGDPVYGTVAEIDVTNTSASPAKAEFAIVLGRRRNTHSAEASKGPMAFAPEETGYGAADGGHAVLAGRGDTVLLAETPGAWGGTGRENRLSYAFNLAPKASRRLRFLAPSVTEPVTVRAYDWDGAPARLRKFWNAAAASGMVLDLPEPGLNDIWRNLLAQSLIITLDDSEVKYGSYSYESYFGVEEGWPAVALAQYGHGDIAQKILGIMLGPRLMDKTNYHHQYRNGLEPWYAVTAYRLSRDRAWLEKIAPDLRAAAEWTIRQIHANKDPNYGGILPRHAYGGDIHTPAYSFYSNATCWRGLHDTALAFRALGQNEAAERYEREAASYRERLLALADDLADRASSPVFLPVSFDVGSGADYRKKEPAYDFLAANVPAGYTWAYLGNFWNLFAPMLLEVKLFDVTDPRSHWVPDYMEARGGVAAGLARFTIGLDQIYGKGYYESLLEHGARSRFLTSLYGVLAHGMSGAWNSFPEVAGIFPLRFDNAVMWDEYRRNVWNWGFQGWENSEGQPLSAGPGMALQLLRMAVVRESVESEHQDTLRLLDGAPASWFAPGRKIRALRAPTFFGEVSVETEGSREGVSATVRTGAEFRSAAIVLRVPRARRVTVNGKPWTDISGDEIRLPGAGNFEVRVRY